MFPPGFNQPEQIIMKHPLSSAAVGTVVALLVGRSKLLIPLGKPSPDAPKFFSASKVERVANDQDWLNAAT